MEIKSLTHDPWPRGPKEHLRKIMSPDLLLTAPPNTDAIPMSEHLIETLAQDPFLDLLARPYETPWNKIS